MKLNLHLNLELALLFVATIGLVCCAKENQINDRGAESDNELSKSEYLSFNSQTEFDHLVQGFIDIENGRPNPTKSATGIQLPSGFVSIAQMEQQRMATKGGEDDEEMTVDEFNIMKAKSLLPDPVLCNLLDTTLRITVGNDFYKITKFGTFVTPKGNEEELIQFVDGFEQVSDMYKMTEDDSVLVINEKIKLVNTFRYTPVEDYLAYEGQENSVPTTKSTVGEYASKYGLTSHKLEGRTWFSNNIWSIFGTDHSRENYFSADRRVKFVVFDVDYVFYSTAGIKVEMEQRKKFLFVKYWVDTDAEKIAIGFNKFEGTITYNSAVVNPNSNPSPSDVYSKIQALINSQYHIMLYNGYSQLSLLSDWSSTILDFVPQLSFKVPTTNMSLDQFIKNQVGKLIEKPQFVFSWLESLNNQYVFEPGRRFLIQKDSPRALHTLIGVDKERVYQSGVQEYGRQERKVVRFFSGGGIRVSLGGGVWNFGPFQPANFSYGELDLFGAAYYNGTWKGIRFYTQ